MIRVTVLEAKALKSPMVETEHLMLSILKNKENIATQILNQFDVDYDLFRNELGVVGTSNHPPRREFTAGDDDEIDEERRRAVYKQHRTGTQPGAAQSNTQDRENDGRELHKRDEHGNIAHYWGRTTEIGR